MRYLVLASDYDGTLAHDGKVDQATIRAVERLIRSGRKLILVTGRVLAELESVFTGITLCELVVAENGAVLYRPGTQEKRTLAQHPPEDLIANLRRRGVTSISVGEVIVATWRVHEESVREALREFAPEYQLIFNKESLMMLPKGIDKQTGLRAALEELQIPPEAVAGIGDAENDLAFLEYCGLSVAVANAIPELKERVDLVTREARGAGTSELIDRLIENDGPGATGGRIRQPTAGRQPNKSFITR